MLTIALYQPEIPPNTGNIIRLCANTGAQLYLIEPLGFDIDDKRMRRAGLDYHEWADVKKFPSFETLQQANNGKRIIGFTTKATQFYTKVEYQADDILLFGPETRGLPTEILMMLGPDHLAKLPMQTQSRSLNLSNSVAVGLYEAWRQLNFIGL